MTNTQALMKHCASVLRNRAMDKTNVPSIGDVSAKFLTRKELINIINTRYKQNIPKEYNLIELENTELLKVIGDEMFIISYLSKKWCTDIHKRQN